MNPDLIQGYSRAGHPIVNFIDLTERGSDESDLVRAVGDESDEVDELAARRRGRRTQPPQ